MRSKYVLSALIAAGLAVTGCSREEKKAEASTKRPEPPSIQTVPAQTRVLDKTIFVTGSLHPDETVTVSSEVPGRITRLVVDFGQRVEKNQIVAELDTQELRLNLARSRAALVQALARVGLGPNEADAQPEDTPSVRQARANMEDARSKFEIAERLVKSGDMARERYNEAEKILQARTAAYEASRDEVRTLLAHISALKAEVALAEKRVADATVRAPFTGEISQKLVSPGEYLKENTPIYTLVKADPMRLRVEIPETAAAIVRPGTQLRFKTDAVPDRLYSAVVRELNPSLDAQNRTLTAEARLTSANGKLRPGMFVQVELVLNKGSRVVMVPKEAVYSIAGLTKVFVIRDGRALERRVITGIEANGWVEVPQDQISAGDQIAVTQVPVLVEGMAVKTVPKA
jgi:RND family efflux transporter MFP subunit